MSNELRPEDVWFTKVINGLHDKRSLHPFQVKVARDVFVKKVKSVFVQTGRNWGKTELAAYCLWRYALSHPNSENYYFSPFMKQSREIVWASHRIQNYGPGEFVEGKPNDTEMRIRFSNGSFIKIDGSDNVESYRGVKPRGLSVFDEFKDFRPEFYVAYEPNLAAHQAPLMILGTPPDRECQFIQVSKEFRNDPNKRFYKAPSQQNPHLSRDWLAEVHKTLISRGEEDVWQREYLAEYIPGGVSKIIPMWSTSLVANHDQIIRAIKRDMRKLDWFVITDPAAASIFGALFIAINPFNRKFYILDEIYESDQAEMTVMKIGSRILAMKKELCPFDVEWMQTYDEAETWFAKEMLDHFQENFTPTHKAKSDKESGLALIKDLILSGNCIVSDRCRKLFWEVDNYYKDKNGKIPKVNDHLIDCWRYALDASHYSLEHAPEVQEDPLTKRRAYTMADDFPGEQYMEGDYT